MHKISYRSPLECENAINSLSSLLVGENWARISILGLYYVASNGNCKYRKFAVNQLSWNLKVKYYFERSVEYKSKGI